MPLKKNVNSGLRPKKSQGFILLEVLIAMSMILGVWVTSVGVYQRLALNLAHQEAKRSQLRKELDIFETQEQARANPRLSGNTLIHEPTRMFGRNHSVRTTSQSTSKDRR